MSTPELGFRIARISIPSFSYSSERVQSVEQLNLNFRIGNGIRFNVSDRIVIFWLAVDAETAESEQSVIHIESNMAFEIENIEDLVRDGQFHLPKELAVTFASISFSTLRGILYQRLAGTPLQAVILPVINPSELVPDPYPEWIELEEFQNNE